MFFTLFHRQRGWDWDLPDVSSGAPLSAPRPSSPAPRPEQRAPSPLALPAGGRRNNLRLGSPQGRVRAGAPRGRAGAAMSALDPRGQQNTAGEAGGPPRRPPAGDKRDPGSGLLTGEGFPGADAREAEEMRRERSGTLPAPGRTRPHPRPPPGLAPGLPRASSVPGRRRVAGAGLCPAPWHQGDGADKLQRSALAPGLLERFWACLTPGRQPPRPSAPSRSRSALGNASWGSVLVVFLCICTPGLRPWLSQPSPSVTCVSRGAERLECPFQGTLGRERPAAGQVARSVWSVPSPSPSRAKPSGRNKRESRICGSPRWSHAAPEAWGHQRLRRALT